MRDQLRPRDLLGRHGGEEFTVLLPDTPLAVAEASARRIHAAVARIGFLADGAAVPLRVSIGVAALEPGEEDIDRLIRRADQAMYAAKRAGRNQVRIAPPG
jgi:diguanylate cyclase (GGDEF)-like protein